MAPELGLECYDVPKKSWRELYDHVRFWRSKLREAFGRGSWGSFEFRTGKDEGTGRKRTRLYALGSLSPDRDHTLMYVDIPDVGQESSDHLYWRGLLEESEVLQRGCANKRNLFVHIL